MRHAALIAGLLLAACDGASSPPAAAPAGVAFNRITYHITGGIVDSDFRLTLEGDGRYVLADHDRPTKQGALPAEELEVLRRRLAKIAWAEVGPSYADETAPYALIITVRVEDAAGAHETKVGDPPASAPPPGVVDLVSFLRPITEQRPRTRFE